MEVWYTLEERYFQLVKFSTYALNHKVSEVIDQLTTKEVGQKGILNPCVLASCWNARYPVLGIATRQG